MRERGDSFPVAAAPVNLAARAQRRMRALTGDNGNGGDDGGDGIVGHTGGEDSVRTAALTAAAFQFVGSALKYCSMRRLSSF